MCSEDVQSCADTGDVEVVNLAHSRFLTDPLADLVEVKPAWCFFQEDVD